MKVTIYADGGSRGNPGVAGSGTAVFDAATHELLREVVYVVGKKSTNNVAEYHGLLRGLEAAAELGASEVYMFMDSKLVVEQMSGRWKIKHPDMKQLALKGKELAKKFDRVAYTWVPRAQNEIADKLSNDAMDAAASGHEPGIVGGWSPESEAAAESEEAPQPVAPEAARDTERKSPWSSEKRDATRLILLRHGQTPLSVDRKYSGRVDAQLTDLGKRQAEAAADCLAERDIDVIVTSPLARCTDTAQKVADKMGLEVRVIEDLQECDFGEWEGLSFHEADSRDPEDHDAWIQDATLAPPGGESFEDVNKRVRSVRRKLVDEYEGKTVLVVTHVNPIKSILRQALDAGPRVYARLFLELASISEVDFLGDDAPVPSVVRSVNDIAHLRAAKCI